MDRSLRLAALASAAVPGLDPMSVQEILGGVEGSFDVAFIQDTQQRRWVIRAPRTEVAAAHLDASLAMLALLVRRVPFAVPAAKGFAQIPKIGRASVHSYIPGQPLDLTALQPRHPVTADLGRTIAMIHNVDRALYEEAGLASYDAESYRVRHLSEIDRGAATGRVPAGLLGRWEEALDDVRLWRFAPTPIHGDLSGSDVLVTFPDPMDATKATVRGVTGWESAKVADPADDFAHLVSQAGPEVVEAVLAAYAHVRVERPDDHLLARARLVSELDLLGSLLRAVARRDDVATEATTARLRRLDDTVHSDTLGRRLRIVPSAALPADAQQQDVVATPSSSSGESQSRPPEESAVNNPSAPPGDSTDVIEVVASAPVDQGDEDHVDDEPAEQLSAVPAPDDLDHDDSRDDGSGESEGSGEREADVSDAGEDHTHDSDAPEVGTSGGTGGSQPSA